MAGQQPQKYPKVDIRKDPFTQEDQSVLVENEEYTIPAASPFYVQLDEVPRLDDPSSMVVYLTDLLAEDLDVSETIVTVEHGSYFNVGDIIQIDDEQMLIGGISSNDLSVTRGYGGTTPATHSIGTRFFLTAAFTEVLVAPTARQYQVHYGTTAIPYKAGLVRFSEDHAGAVVWVTYYKTGHYNWAEFVGLFTYNILTGKSYVLLAESNVEIIQNIPSTTWTLMKTITFTKTVGDILLWVKFDSRISVDGYRRYLKITLDDGIDYYAFGEEGFSGNVLGDFLVNSDAYQQKHNQHGGFLNYGVVFSEIESCPLNISGLTNGEHTLKLYARSPGGATGINVYIKNLKVYSTRL